MQQRGQSDPVDAVCDLILETELAIGWVGQGGTEEELQACLRHPAHMASTDGCLVGGHPHPRGWGTYPRYLGRYVRGEPIKARPPSAVYRFRKFAQRNRAIVDSMIPITAPSANIPPIETAMSIQEFPL